MRGHQLKGCIYYSATVGQTSSENVPKYQNVLKAFLKIKVQKVKIKVVFFSPFRQTFKWNIKSSSTKVLVGQ